jgi:hypothetical protein
LLADNDLLLTIDFCGSMNGPDVPGVLKELLLLLQFADELGPPDMDRIVGILGDCSERE